MPRVLHPAALLIYILASVALGRCQSFAGSSTGRRRERLARKAGAGEALAPAPVGRRQDLGRAGEDGEGVEVRRVCDARTDSRRWAFRFRSADAVDAVASQAGALNGKAGGNDHRGNMSANSAARALSHWAPARNASK